MSNIRTYRVNHAMQMISIPLHSTTNSYHLGNNDEVVDAKGVVQQVTNYYPFGTPYTYKGAVLNADVQPYKYNRKELDRMHGLNTYDYGARQYNPVTGRWDRMDPHCESYYNVSPYVYCHNNPVMKIDPDGKDDYYTSDGKFLGSNNKKTDYIYISDNYKQLKNGSYVIKSRVALSESDISAKAWSSILTDIGYRNGVDVRDLANSEFAVFKLKNAGPGDAADPLGYAGDGWWGDCSTTHGMIDSDGRSSLFSAVSETYKKDGNLAKITAFIYPVGDPMRQYYTTVSNIVHLLRYHEYELHYLEGLPDGAYLDSLLRTHPLWPQTTPIYKQFVNSRKGRD